ncbi:MAG: hypothetical protein CM1200mP18_06890 [Gammaproteobacteria bacterium]|nr:MAG: hypothetical protein CM1200mP18_06890 [Gammaproteobacteria bacterium]
MGQFSPWYDLDHSIDRVLVCRSYRWRKKRESLAPMQSIYWVFDVYPVEIASAFL